MNIDKILVIIFGLAGVVFIYWFFLMKKEKEVKVSKEVDIKVSGGYSPKVILVPAEKTTKINFLRTDPNECLAEIILPDFKIKKQLPLNKTVTVEITPEKTGEYEFACSMNMYRGKIIVK